MDDTGARLPWTFRAFAVASLLWNASGGWMFITGFRGMAAAHMLPPAWIVALWAIGVWASLGASLALLARRRMAIPIFAVSFVGAVGSYAARAIVGRINVVEAVVILGLIALQWAYARRAARQGWLR